jgi:hypothetical protein
MPYTVKIDLNTTRLQQVAIQDASPVAVGVMTKLQAQQLADLVKNGVSEAMSWTVTPIKLRDYFAAVNEFVPVNSQERAVTITLPAASADNKGKMIAAKAVINGSTDITVEVDGGGLIDGAASFTYPSRNFYCAVFVSNGTNWNLAYFYLGTPIV